MLRALQRKLVHDFRAAHILFLLGRRKLRKNVPLRVSLSLEANYGFHVWRNWSPLPFFFSAARTMSLRRLTKRNFPSISSEIYSRNVTQKNAFRRPRCGGRLVPGSLTGVFHACSATSLTPVWSGCCLHPCSKTLPAAV